MIIISNACNNQRNQSQDDIIVNSACDKHYNDQCNDSW